MEVLSEWRVDDPASGAPAGGVGVTTAISRILPRSGDELLRQRDAAGRRTAL
jgi:hypothetical protein